MFKIRFGLIIAVIVLLSGMVLAQDTTDSSTRNQDMNSDSYKTDSQSQQNQSDNITIRSWTDDLKTRLSLTDDQVTQLQGILSRYQSESSSFKNDTPETMNNTRDEVQKRYSTEIEGILNESQKAQWRSYSSSWWNTVNTTGTEKENLHNQQNDQYNRDNQGDFDENSKADSSRIK